MDRQPATSLHALLSALDPSVAEPALQPLERLVSRPGSADALIIAIVGTSGVGKSEIVNALAGARVVTAGPLRPTTTEIAVWGDVDTTYLPGTRVSGPEPPEHVALIDTPAAEHYPDTIVALLDNVDAVVFVTSPERYADATTATLLAGIRERGIPMRVVLSVDARNPSDLEELVEDTNVKLGTPVDVVIGEDVSPLRLLLDEMARGRDDLIEQRDRAAAAFCAMQTREVAEALEARISEFQPLTAMADEGFARARVDRRRLAAVADDEWDVAARTIAGMASESIDRVIRELADDVAGNEVFSRAVADATATLPSIDRRPIDDWYWATTDLALASIKRRRLHPRRSKAVREEMWRLSIDFDRRPPKAVRKALRDRLPDLRFDRGAAMTGALRDAGSARIAAFRRNLDPSGGVSADDLRVAADAVAASGSMLREVADDVA
ncbi:MAG: GTPase [Actinomycetota bacterium]|nr:GTPase [Actinomycetota bacterium]